VQAGGLQLRAVRDQWWQHGHSSERDFIYVTTQNLSAEQLQALSDEVGASAACWCAARPSAGVTAAQAAERWPNLTHQEDSEDGAGPLRVGA
jgi:hypothetical protein